MAKPKTPTCRNGHPMTVANTIIRISRDRPCKRCRICWNAYRRDRRAQGVKL